MNKTKWSEEAWNNIQPVFEAVTRHPFLTGLTDGSLARDKFLFYLNQDALYLDDFGKVLAGLAVKSAKRGHVEDFLSFARDTIEVERQLHRSFLGSLDPAARPSPTCLLYTSFLHRQLAAAPLEVAAATVLPCFWVYKEVGEYILAQVKQPQNPFQSWIDTYGGDEYGRAVSRAIAMADELAEETTAAIRQEMTRAFELCTKMEWMFWDSGWRQEAWPV